MTQGMPQDAEHPLVGQTVGKYKIVKLLGEGGMGCVYMAEQQLGTTTRKVALKTLHKHLSHDPSIKARFDREAGTVAALEHPNTIQVYDFGAMEDGTLYLVMEFVSGKSVADTLIQEGPMPAARVENILKQVCGSLEEAHGHGIVHRDLKPDNVVLCERAGQKDWVEVLDFGIAKRSSEHDPNEAKLTQQGMVLGTPPYMSPEQFTGQPVDVRSDIYALGVMAYEMLSGTLPWEANTAWEWASKHMTEMPTPLERQLQAKNLNAPQHMRDAIARALAKNKDERFASVKEFFTAFSGGSVVPSLAAAQAEAPPVNSGGQAARPKTEMAQPMMGGGPPPGAFNAGPPAGGMGGPAMGGAPVVPPGPVHQGPQKSGPPLVPILGGVAALLLIGSVGAYFATQKKPVTPTTFDPSTNTSASATTTDSATTPETNPEGVVTAAPALDTSNTNPVQPAQNTSSSGGTKPSTTPTPKPNTAPIPTPKPAEAPMTPACVTLKNARAANQNAQIIAALEGKCRASGGDPDKAR